METIAILVKGGTVQGVYKVTNSPHNRIIIVDDDNLRDSSDRRTEQTRQMQGWDLDGELEYKNVLSELAGYSLIN